jgi:hypothetical protein
MPLTKGAAAGDDAFLNGGAGGVQSVLDAELLVLHLGLGGSADLDDGHAAGQLGKALLELFLVVVGGGGSIWARICATRALILLDSPAPSTMVVFSLVTLT